MAESNASQISVGNGRISASSVSRPASDRTPGHSVGSAAKVSNSEGGRTVIASAHSTYPVAPRVGRARFAAPRSGPRQWPRPDNVR